MVKKKIKKENKSISDVLGFWNIFSGEKAMFILGILSIAIAVLMFFSFFSFFSNGDADQSLIEAKMAGEAVDPDAAFKNICSAAGAYTAYFFIKQCFGMAAFAIPVLLTVVGLRLMKVYDVSLLKWTLCTMLVMVLMSLTLAKFLAPSFIDSSFNPGGDHGLYMSNLIEGFIGTPGLIVILICIALVFLTYLTIETIYLIRKVLNPITYFTSRVKFTIVTGNDTQESETEAPAADELGTLEDPEVFDDPQTEVVDFGEITPDNNDSNEQAKAIGTGENAEFIVENGEGTQSNDDVSLEISEGETEDKADGKNVAGADDIDMTPYDPKRDLEKYHYPTLDLLKKYESDGKPYIDMEEQNTNKNKIISVLRNFGVEISSIKATVGPTITLYEVTPASGVRISKIRSLEDDIALSLRALGIRIIAPIPGKGTIGIEVPNEKPNIVSMESILNSKKFQETTMELPCAVGKTITNEVFMFDLAKIPHLLVAGATGQGKSVGLNAILTSLLYKKHPAEMKIVLVDPKKVEFSIYSPIVNHFLAQIPNDNDEEAIITDVTKVVKTLNSLCKEMDTRYDLLKMAGARNVKEYNKKFIDRKLNPEKGHHYMPYIVVVVDEYGDLIMTAGKEIELPIARIAQLARAVGIHMIIATQRPTTNIITGTIKANFPGRIAFKTSASIDSKTILDRTGANQLIGRGDMLFTQGNEPVRVQCAFVDTPEVERINEFIGKQQSYGCPFELPEPDVAEADAGGAADVDMQQLDPMFAEAARLIVMSQSGSTSLIQRKFAIGYNRAGRLMDQLERAGVVGAASGSKPREVLIQDEVSLTNLLTSLHL